MFAVWNKQSQKVYLQQLQRPSANNKLEMLGLERGPLGVRVALNKRLYNKVDLEHAGCKIGVYVPKLSGGGGSVSVKPRKQAPHCHPVCSEPFEEGISRVEIKLIKDIAQKSVRAFKKAILNDTWKDPGGIMGEKCWRRPENYN